MRILFLTILASCCGPETIIETETKCIQNTIAAFTDSTHSKLDDFIIESISKTCIQRRECKPCANLLKFKGR